MSYRVPILWYVHQGAGGYRTPGMQCPRGEKKLPECLQSGEGFWVLGHVAGIILRRSDFDHYRCPLLFHLSELAGRSGRVESVNAPSMPLTWIDAGGQRKIWTIYANLQDWCGDRTTGWQLVCRSIWPLGIDNWRLFRSRRHDDWDSGEAVVDIVLLWLIEILRMWTIFSGIEDLNGDGLALPPPSINRLKSFV